jgi:pilus assembly protein CpaD
MRKIAILSTVAMGIAVSGCLGGGGTVNRQLESVHQPVVTQQNFTFDVPVTNGELAPSDLNQLTGWLTAMNVRYGDRVSIDDSAAFGANATRGTVDELLRRQGMMLTENAPITPGAIPAGHVRVIISRASARVDGCPNWRTRSAIDYSTTTTSNYGCATNANMAAMIADPMDLVRGQSDRSNDPLTASNAVAGYRRRASQSGGSLPSNDGGVRGTVNTGRDVGGTEGGGAPALPGGGGR